MKQRSAISLSNDWATPLWLYRELDGRYGPFDLDAAAAPWNAKCERFYTKRENALVQPWGRRTWCNPPYSSGFKEAFSFRGRCHVEDRKSELACFLLPNDTSDGYWSRVVHAPAGKHLGTTEQDTELGRVVQTRWEYLTVERTEIRGRLKYRHRTGATGTARHSSAVVVFARPGLLQALAWSAVRTFGRRAA